MNVFWFSFIGLGVIMGILTVTVTIQGGKRKCKK